MQTAEVTRPETITPATRDTDTLRAHANRVTRLARNARNRNPRNGSTGSDALTDASNALIMATYASRVNALDGSNVRQIIRACRALADANTNRTATRNALVLTLAGLQIVTDRVTRK